MDAKTLKYLKCKALNGREVIELTKDPTTNIFSYVDLHKLNSIDELLGPSRSCILLYEWKENFGHWVCVFEDIDGRIEVFDSYGIYKPDDELKFIPKQYAQKYNENFPYLTKLLFDSGYDIEYNNHRYQDLKDNTVATCGRYAGCRLYFRNLRLADFNKIFTYNKNIKPDDLITVISDLISNNII